MAIRNLLRIAASAKICIDSVGLLQAINRRSLNVQDWIYRFLRFSPALLDNARRSAGDLLETADRFSQAVSYFRFGAIFKLTHRARTNIADSVALRLALEYPGPRLVEVGVSDGSSAAGLLDQRQRFSEIVLTDRYNVFFYKLSLLGRLFYDADGRLVLVKFLCLSIDLSSLGRMGGAGLQRIETVNPLLRQRHSVERIERFDMFTDVLPVPAQIIRCANILNTSYFPPETIRLAVLNLARSLSEGGVLIVSQNNACYSGGEAYFALRKEDGAMKMLEGINHHDVEELFQ
ncbi:MAG: hypothetical protein KKA55_00025 [Proteobacteria bacterium]|nr:hypothetical protein [Pseudomonadota bacterium]MBU1593901.1 hypothetical protein [Pseudomonadota bacterium]